ncbi:MAG: DUF448 domain-containing protein [Helicobacter sp.]|nr:DUF448 domain-containing protein [Helicobacter sp.]
MKDCALKSREPAIIQRTCIACRAKFEQKDLVRLKIQNGKITHFDGFCRSFYVCPNCLHKASFKKVILKQNLADKSMLQQSLEEFLHNECENK